MSQLWFAAHPPRETAVTNTPVIHSGDGIVGRSVHTAGIVFVADPIGCVSHVGHPSPPVPVDEAVLDEDAVDELVPLEVPVAVALDEDVVAPFEVPEPPAAALEPVLADAPLPLVPRGLPELHAATAPTTPPANTAKRTNACIVITHVTAHSRTSPEHRSASRVQRMMSSAKP